MGRPKRALVSQDAGSYHIVSRIAGGDFLLKDEDKDYFLKHLERFAQGFFVQIHAFNCMTNHFHILSTVMEKEAMQATEEELHRRYRLLYPKSPSPPEGRIDSYGTLIPDEDGGLERLRRRLGSVSQFVQEFKKTYSCWFNKKHNRYGYLWGNRFKGVIVGKGEAQLTCSAYIDLNPIRANMVEKPEDYRWSSLGLRVRSPKRANEFLYPLAILPTTESEGSIVREFFAPLVLRKNNYDHLCTYREFVYRTGGVKRDGCAHIKAEHIDDVMAFHGNLGLNDRLGYRIKNLSEGLAFGGYALIENMQQQLNRKFIRPRSFMGRDETCSWSFCTRVLRL